LRAWDSPANEVSRFRAVRLSLNLATAILLLLFDLDGFGHAFGGGLPDQVVVLLRDFVELDNGQQLILVVFENLGTKFVAVAVAHTLSVDAYFHCILLSVAWGRLG
jgi:hypothetical protein